MVHFIGAGPGAPDLLTLRGARLLGEADVVIYAGSLVNPELLRLAKPGCEVHNSAELTRPGILAVIEAAERAGKTTVRLHTGDPSLYGALREQLDALTERGVAWDLTPGVSSLFGAAAALGAEFTLPGVSQSLIVTRCAGRTAVPEAENLAALASHGASMALFLSAGHLENAREQLLAGGMAPDTPAALVYRATWPDERVVRCTVGTLPEAAKAAGVRRTALVLAGRFLEAAGAPSRLYAPDFSTGYREAEA